MIGLLTVLVVAAPFEGVLQVNATIEQVGTIASEISVRKNGDARVDSKSEALGIAVSMLRRRDGSTYQLLHEQKQFVPLPVKEQVVPPEVAALNEDDAVEVKKLGKETVVGFVCEHVQVREIASRTVVDLWLTHEIEVPDVFAIVAPDQAPDAIVQDALKRRGLNGYPMRSVTVEAGHTVTVETVKVERKAMPAEAFVIPKTYVKADAPPTESK
jgi:hypothetical protein